MWQLDFPGRPSLALDRPRVVGILNLTPDSFSDGGAYADVGEAVAAGVAMARQGAAIVDVGGESTRPGAKRVGVEEQKRRVLPAITRLRLELDAAGFHATAISIDTTRSDVAAAALDAGASMLNDISAGREDPSLLTLAAQRGVPIVLMHMRGEPGTMQDAPHYDAVVPEVHNFLAERAEAAIAAGVRASQVVLDPGIGFGKTLAHNLALLASLRELVAAGYPVLLGASRKRFIEALMEADPGAEPRSGRGGDRLGGTVATTAVGVAAGVRLFRVHDVWANHQAATLAWAVKQAQR